MALATLGGSEGQVAWASEIRAEFVGKYEALRAGALADYDANTAPLVELGMGDEVAAGRIDVAARYDAIAASIQGHTDAGWWIDVARGRQVADLVK